MDYCSGSDADWLAKSTRANKMHGGAWLLQAAVVKNDGNKKHLPLLSRRKIDIPADYNGFRRS